MAKDTNISDEMIAKVREHREDLGNLAESDLPIAWAAEALLDLIDEDVETNSERRGRTE